MLLCLFITQHFFFFSHDPLLTKKCKVVVLLYQPLIPERLRTRRLHSARWVTTRCPWSRHVKFYPKTLLRLLSAHINPFLAIVCPPEKQKKLRIRYSKGYHWSGTNWINSQCSGGEEYSLLKAGSAERATFFLTLIQCVEREGKRNLVFERF